MPYTVAQTIQDILARRRQDERQMMLDRLTEEGHRGELAESQERMEQGRRQMSLAEQQEQRMRESSEAQTALTKEQMFQMQAEGLPMGATDVPDAAFKEQLIQRGRMPEQEVMGPTETGDPMSPIRAYAGTEAQQKEAREQQLKDELVARYGGEGASANEQRAAELMRAGFNPPASMFEQLYPQRIYGPTGNLISEDRERMMPAGAATEVLGFSPMQGATMNTPINHRVTYANGNVEDVLLTPLQAQQVQQQPDVQSIVAVNRAAFAAPRVPPQIMNRVIAARGPWEAARAEGNSRWFAGSRGPSDAMTATRAVYEQALGAAFSYDPADPDMKQLAIDIITDPVNPNMGIDEAIEALDIQGLTPQQRTTVDRLINIARGVSLGAQ